MSATSASRGNRETREHGYRGSQRSVQRHLARLTAGTVEPVRITVPTAHTIATWIIHPREHLSSHDREALLKARLACPDIARACDLAWAFLEMARHQRGVLLRAWIRQAELEAPKPMRTFASYLRQDLDAVTAGLTLPYSSGVVEGHVNRLRRSRGRCTGGVRSSYSVLESSFDRDRHEISTRAARPRHSGASSCAPCGPAVCPECAWSSPTTTPAWSPRSARSCSAPPTSDAGPLPAQHLRRDHEGLRGDGRGDDPHDLRPARLPSGPPAVRRRRRHARPPVSQGQRDAAGSEGRPDRIRRLPGPHWKKIQSTNPLERINREIKRRTDVVQVFPNDDALLRLTTAVLFEMHDEWIAFPRRYLPEGSMDKIYSGNELPATTPSQGT